MFLTSAFSWIGTNQPISFPKLGLELDPPSGFMLGNMSIYFYGVIIALGLFLAVAYALKRRKQFGLLEDDILDGVLWIVPVSIICARAYYCAFRWEEFAADPISVLYIWKGGIAIYGGIIGAALCVVIHCAIKKISLPAVLDVVALSFLIGQFIGRWGNFFNREAFGAYCDTFLAMRVPSSVLHVSDDASKQLLGALATLKDQAAQGGYTGFYQVHPTFLYESLWNLAGFIALHFLSKKRRYDGQIALAYVAWYGLGRTFIEGLRMDSLYIGTFRVSQLVAAATCFIAVGILLCLSFLPHPKKKLFVNARGELKEPEKKPLFGKKKAEAAEDEQAPSEETEEAVADEPAQEATDTAAEESSEKQAAEKPVEEPTEE